MFYQESMMIWQCIRVVLCSLALIAFGVGCSSSAHIARRGAPAVHGEIARSDAQALYVEVENNDWVTVPRADIESVDHPGNVAGIIGTTVFVVGTAFAMAFVPTLDDHKESGTISKMFFGIGLGIAAIGAVPAGWGWWTYGQSKSAASHE